MSDFDRLSEWVWECGCHAWMKIPSREMKNNPARYVTDICEEHIEKNMPPWDQPNKFQTHRDQDFHRRLKQLYNHRAEQHD